MNHQAPRYAALVAAPLAVVAATALVLLPRGDNSPPAPSPDGPIVVISRPDDGAILPLDVVTVEARADDADGVSAVELRVDDDVVAREITSGGATAEVELAWEPDEAGDVTLLVRARDAEGRWGEAAVTVSVGTGEPPLPPPPTTVVADLIETSTTESTTTTLGPTSTLTTAATTTTRPATSTPISPIVPEPTSPTTEVPPPSTDPPITLPPPTDPSTTTTVPPTTTTIAPTTTTAAPPPTLTVPPPCKLEEPTLLSPADRSVGVPTQPLFVWGYFDSCAPSAQALRIRGPGGFGVDVPVAASARAYQLSFPLPPCADIRWDVVAFDATGRDRDSRDSRFITTGC